MFVLQTCTKFSAAHRIEGHPKCGSIHGHTFTACVWVLEEKPFEIDLEFLGETLENVVRMLDHKYLNEVFNRNVVLSEDLAYWVYEEVSRRIGDKKVVLVRICEDEGHCVYYLPRVNIGVLHFDTR